jgi:lipoic acid synthetase
MSQTSIHEIPIENLKQRRETMSKGEYKTKSLRYKPDPTANKLKKPRWIKAKLPPAKHMGRIKQLKTILKEQQLNTVCVEASCPNLGECFGQGTATFMIMGHICTRKCPFCDVTHGRPNELDANEPKHLADTIALMELDYVVITSVDRDDLKDGGAGHFVKCIEQIRKQTPHITIETLVPDFKGRMKKSLDILLQTPPDVLNHNLETIARLYDEARPAASYQGSLDLLKSFKKQSPHTTTKSGIMVGLGETFDEIVTVMKDLRKHDVDMLTIGQYLQPSDFHLSVKHYWSPDDFKKWQVIAEDLGFRHVASGPMVRSSYHAELQVKQSV